MSILIKNSCDGKYNSMDVRFTKSCDNDCPFCIEKTGLDSLGKTDVKALIESTIASNIKDILILGGEPFLLPEKLLEYVKGIRSHVDTIYITTSLPKTLIDQKSICHEIIDLVDGLNVSIQHYSSMRNNDVLRASSRHNRILLLKELNTMFARKIRTSINLTKSGISDKGALLATLIMLEEVGCKHIKINELQNSDEYISYEDIMGVKMKSPYSHGCQTEIDHFDTEMKITLKRSCFITEKSRNATLLDIAKIAAKKFSTHRNDFKVLYENGRTEVCWLKQ